MPPRRSSASPTGFISSSSSSSRDRMMQEQEDSTGSRERLIFPQHLQLMIQSATKVTIIYDNAKVPPLSPWSPILREQRGLPPYLAPGRGDTSKSSLLASDNSRRKPESRWDSMPQPKRLNDEFPAFPSLAQIRQSGYLHGHDIGYGIPLQYEGPVSTTPSASANDTNNNNNITPNNHDRPPGLNIPRRRESFEIGKEFANKDGVSLLSQVLNAFDLSDEEDEDCADPWIAAGAPAQLPPLPPPPPGRYASPPPSRRVLPSIDTRPALSPAEPARKSAGGLSIPVRRDSMDSVDVDVLKEDLAGFFSDEDESEHLDFAEDDDDEFYEDTEEEEEDDEDDFDEEVGCAYPGGVCKDDSTLATSTTSTTLSTLRSSSSSRDEARR